jgi:histidinol-phosphate aminotransferase
VIFFLAAAYNPGMALSFIRPAVREMDGYVPGEQPPPGSRVVKLNTNENPFPPGEKVMQALRDLSPESLRRYPSPTADCFRRAAGKLLGVSPDCILAGNGSDDLLTIATRTFIPPAGTLAFPEPTYSLYSVLACLQAAKAVAVPWEEDWSLPIAALVATKADAIYLANPNAPSGTFVPPAEIEKLAGSFDGLLLIDEAYADFAEANCLSLVQRFPNVIVTRTMSKAYSLAGLRFGFAVAQASVVAEMNKVKDSYNCDAVSQAVATAAIEDQEYARRAWDHVKAERQRLTETLREFGWSVLPSQANFILASCPGGDGKGTYLGLKSQGILVRYFDLPGLKDKVRITVGTVQENNALLAGVRALPTAYKAA